MENNELEQARIKWQQAINVFNNAVTKEDIDYAVYNLEAKKKQYVRLLKIYKNEAQLKDDFE
jgi:5-bromo-4-chloroindolyl phosphate hydrolysis protein